MLKTLFITPTVALARWIKYLNDDHDDKPRSTLDEALCITQLRGFIVLLKDCGSPSAMSQLGSKGHVFPLTGAVAPAGTHVA